MSEEVNGGIIEDMPCNTENSKGYKWQPGQSGNPSGSSNAKREQQRRLKAAFMKVAEGKMDGFWNRVFQSAMEEGNTSAMRIIAERMVPAMTHIETEAPEQTQAVSELTQVLVRAWEAKKGKA